MTPRTLLLIGMLLLGLLATFVSSGLLIRPAVAQQADHGKVLLPGVEPEIAAAMGLLAQGKATDLLARMPLAAGANREHINTQVQQLATLASVAGRYTGYDIAAVQTLGQRFEEVYVLAHYENEPIVLRFGLYRTGNPESWQVLRFSTQTDVDHLLDSLPLQAQQKL